MFLRFPVPQSVLERYHAFTPGTRSGTFPILGITLRSSTTQNRRSVTSHSIYTATCMPTYSLQEVTGMHYVDMNLWNKIRDEAYLHIYTLHHMIVASSGMCHVYYVYTRRTSCD